MASIPLAKRRKERLMRKQASVMHGAFTIGEQSSEFADEALDLVDRSNTVDLQRMGCPVGGLPPHGTNRRAVHPHGKLYAGRFESTGNAASLSYASQLMPGYKAPAVVRISNFIRPLDQPDVMGLAVKLEDPHGTWDLVATSVRRFIAGNLAAFRAMAAAPVARALPRTASLFTRGLMNGASLAALVALTRAQARVWPGRTTRYQTTYWGVHTYRLVNDSCEVPFKFRWRPVRNAPGRFELYLDLVDPGWKHLGNPARAPWRWGPSSGRRRGSIHAGTLHVEIDDDWRRPRSDRNPDTVMFLPTRVPAGIGLTNDEILFARGGAYQLSFLRRTQGKIDEAGMG